MAGCAGDPHLTHAPAALGSLPGSHAVAGRGFAKRPQGQPSANCRQGRGRELDQRASPPTRQHAGRCPGQDWPQSHAGTERPIGAAMCRVGDGNEQAQIGPTMWTAQCRAIPVGKYVCTHMRRLYVKLGAHHPLRSRNGSAPSACSHRRRACVPQGTPMAGQFHARWQLPRPARPVNTSAVPEAAEEGD